MKTYGEMRYLRPDPEQGRALEGWALHVHPHVAIKVKRMFPRVRQDRSVWLTLTDTTEVAHDLEWLLWRYPLVMTDEDREVLERRASEWRETQDATEMILTGQKRVVVPGMVEPALPLRDYQLQAADLAHTTQSLLVADEVGLGKTFTSLGLLRDPMTLPALIVLPTHLPPQWVRQVEKFMPHLSTHIVTQGRPYPETARFRNKVNKLEHLAESDVVMMSYSKLAGWRDYLAGHFRTVIFDEVQELRHDGTDKYDAAARFADKAEWKMGLSATPIYNYGGETWNIFEVLRPGALGTRTEFLREWDGHLRSTGQAVINEANALGQHLRDQGMMIRRTREEVGLPIDKPVEIMHTIPSDSKVLDRIMEDVSSLAEVILGSGDRHERFVAGGQIDMKMRQATGIAKAPYVAQFAKMLLDSEQKVVLFGWHREVYRIWMEHLAHFNPVMYTGSETYGRKDASVRRFIKDDDCRVFMCSLRSGAGLDGLQDVSSNAIFGELDWSPAMHHQAIGRLARDGQMGTVNAFYLVSEDGSDPAIAETLEAKTQQATAIVDPDKGALYTARVDTEHRARRLAEAVLARRR